MQILSKNLKKFPPNFEHKLKKNPLKFLIKLPQQILPPNTSSPSTCNFQTNSYILHHLRPRILTPSQLTLHTLFPLPPNYKNKYAPRTYRKKVGITHVWFSKGFSPFDIPKVSKSIYKNHVRQYIECLHQTLRYTHRYHP